MTTEGFNYKDFAKDIAEQMPAVIPKSICEEDKKYLVSTVKHFIEKTGDAMQNAPFTNLSDEDFGYCLREIAEEVFYKGLCIITSGIPQKHWNSLLQNIAYIIFEVIKEFTENDFIQDEIITRITASVKTVFEKNIDKLMSEKEISEDIAKKAKEFSVLKFYEKYEPETEEAIFLLANLLLSDERYKEAMKYYDKLISMSSDTSMYYQYKASCLFGMQEYGKAIEVYQTVLMLSGNDVILDAIAYCYYMMEDYTNALQYYNKYLEYLEEQSVNIPNMYDDIEDDIEKTYVMIADCYNSNGDSANAMKNYDYVLELNPENFEAIYAKAEWYRNQKCYNAALERYFSLPDTDDSDAKLAVLTNIAFCYDEMKQHEAALEYYDKVLDIVPQSAIAVFNKASCIFEMQQYDKAIQLVRESIALGFENLVDAYRIIIYCDICKNEYSEAMEYCDKILELEPDNAEAFMNKGDCCIRTDNTDEAILYLQKALDNSVKDTGRAYTLLGDCNAEKEDYNTAAECYNSAINAILSINDVSDNLTTSDDYKKSLAYAYYSKGNCLIKSNQSYDAALMCFMRAIDYGYDKYDCEQKIKDIKREWD